MARTHNISLSRAASKQIYARKRPKLNEIMANSDVSSFEFKLHDDPTKRGAGNTPRSELHARKFGIKQLSQGCRFQRNLVNMRSK